MLCWTVTATQPDLVAPPGMCGWPLMNCRHKELRKRMLDRLSLLLRTMNHYRVVMPLTQGKAGKLMKARRKDSYTNYSGDDSHFYRLVTASQFVPCCCVNSYLIFASLPVNIVFHLITFRHVVAHC